ncbi:hypothetical protein [Pedobacter nyackensis]|uniref:Uncharacterized protein n=1 Tax=Pedobacter nyackensis TaxID=475255 RepID=A0A1W1ZXY5_9SPHI|nr:hypothetical protein [Pedobacter nyackensis]SMC53243.1 hypothetical protein SAMN04488101_101141 [Pedobacter nyackensis]
MKDVFDMVTDVRSLVNVPVLTSTINGKVYPNLRPDGRTDFADLVVNGLSITNTQQQIGSGNVNGYVPTITKDGVRVPDQARLSAMGKSIITLIDNQYHDTFRVFVDGGAVPMRDTDGSYFVNVPFKYHSIQDNYQI